MLELIKHLVFGWDTTIALLGFAFVSLLFGEPANLWALAFAGLFAYLPDLDMVPFLLLHRRLNITVGHWVIGHYPPIVLALEALVVAILTHLIWGGHEAFLVVLALVCTTLHFVHDAAAHDHGCPLLAPFTRDWKVRFPIPWTARHPKDLYVHYLLVPRWPFIVVASPQAVEQMYRDVALLSASIESEILGRVEPVTRSQITASTIASVSCLVVILVNG